MYEYSTVLPAEFMKSLCYVNRWYLHSEYINKMEIYYKCIDRGKFEKVRIVQRLYGVSYRRFRYSAANERNLKCNFNSRLSWKCDLRSYKYHKLELQIIFLHNHILAIHIHTYIQQLSLFLNISVIFNNTTYCYAECLIYERIGVRPETPGYVQPFKRDKEPIGENNNAPLLALHRSSTD